MTSFVDLRFAVAVFVVPNLVTNLIQSIVYRRALNNRLFLLILCLSAGLGAFARKSDVISGVSRRSGNGDGGSDTVLRRVPALQTKLAIIDANGA